MDIIIIVNVVSAIIGVTVAVHRLWSNGSVLTRGKSKTPAPKEHPGPEKIEPGTRRGQDPLANCYVEPVPEGYEEHLYEEHESESVMKWIRDMIHDTPRLDWSKVIWPMVAWNVFLHGTAIYGTVELLLCRVKWQTFSMNIVKGILAGLGVTVGVHRLWSHGSLKAVPAMRWSLMYMYSMAYQGSIFLWCQNHRVHHKWSDMDEDFTNAERGFFFAHVGWSMYETHPAVIAGRKKVDCSDLMKLPEVKFQHKYYYYVSILACFVIPIIVPIIFWNEDPLISICNCFFRLAITYNITWSINSVAHLKGTKPYDKNMIPCNNSYLGPVDLGEGYHNYHHAFPKDYRASEVKGCFWNLSTWLIEVLNRWGMTYGLTAVSERAVDARSTKTGDLSLRPKIQKTTEMVYVTPKNN